MYEKIEKKIRRTTKLATVLTYMFIFLSLVIGLYFIVTLNIPKELFKIIEGNPGHILFFDKDFSIRLGTGLFMNSSINMKTGAKIKFIYSYIILKNLTITVFMVFLMYNILRILGCSSLEGTPFNNNTIKHINILKWLIVGLAILPNITKCIFRYTLIEKNIIVFDNTSFLVLIFISLLLNVIKHIFLYGMDLQKRV